MNSCSYCHIKETEPIYLFLSYAIKQYETGWHVMYLPPPTQGRLLLPFIPPEGYDIFVTSQQNSAAFCCSSSDSFDCTTWKVMSR